MGPVFPVTLNSRVGVGIRKVAPWAVVGHCVSALGLLLPRATTGRLEPQRFLISQFGGCTTKIKVSAGLVLPEASLLGSQTGVFSPCLRGAAWTRGRKHPSTLRKPEARLK